MEDYKVHWSDKSWDGHTFIRGGSPREAAKQFLASEPEIRDERILVTAMGFMRGTDVYHPKDLGETVVESKSSEGTGPGGGSGGEAKQASVASSSSSRQEQILLRIESKLSQIHWTVLGVGMMFALVFIITPQCSQM